MAPEAVVQLLEPLEIRGVGRTDQALVFRVPSFRPDITREIDLVEEVARRYGLNGVPSRLPSAGGPWSPGLCPGQGTAPPPERAAMLAAGLVERVTSALNHRRQARDLRLFELAYTFNPAPPALGKELMLDGVGCRGASRRCAFERRPNVPTSGRTIGHRLPRRCEN